LQLSALTSSKKQQVGSFFHSLIDPVHLQAVDFFKP
jgi:hypothetical protein